MEVLLLLKLLIFFKQFINKFYLLFLIIIVVLEDISVLFEESSMVFYTIHGEGNILKQIYNDKIKLIS